jgi:hypothetical protein
VSSPTRRRIPILFASLVGLLLLAAIFGAGAESTLAQANTGYSLRFYGHGVDDIDRAKIPVQTDAGSLPTDIGATDFTIEFWLRGNQGDNLGAAVVCGENEDWIYGSIVFDRDRFAEGRKFGISIDGGGRVVFGVTNAERAAGTICGTRTVLDGSWHHVAVQRRVNDGQLWIFVDGRLDATVAGPTGDLAYPDGVGVTYQGPGYCQGPAGAWGGYCRNEPFIVLGAEKHDAGASAGNPAAYPSFNGWLDELRLSNVLRYTDAFIAPGAPFSGDANTVGLYHFDEGPAGACTGVLRDSATIPGAPTDGVCAYGGAGEAGPKYALETPFVGALPFTPTSATATPTRTAVATATNTPVPPTVTRTPTPLAATATRTPTPLAATATRTATSMPPTATATPVQVRNYALMFDGDDDVVVLAPAGYADALTVEFWVRPAASLMEAIIVNQADDDSGWSFELNAGRPSFWIAAEGGWQVVRHSTRLVAGTWYHVAATYDNGAVRVFVNGQPGAASALGTGLRAAGDLRFGGIPGYGRFAGALDDVRISQVARYATQFTPPTSLPAANADTLGQWAFNEGRGQTTTDGSSAGNQGQLGLAVTVDGADPTWVAVE